MTNKFSFVQVIFLSFMSLFIGQSLAQQQDMKFYENKSQWPEHVLFSARLDAGNIWLEKDRILYHFMDFSEVEASHTAGLSVTESPMIQQALVSTTFVGANREAYIESKRPTKFYRNYFKGESDENWAREVRGYSDVIYKDFYEGINLLFLEKEGVLKYEFHLNAFADPDQIQIRYEGQDEISVDEMGNLHVSTDIGELIENKPFVYQRVLRLSSMIF